MGAAGKTPNDLIRHSCLWIRTAGFIFLFPLKGSVLNTVKAGLPERLSRAAHSDSFFLGPRRDVVKNAPHCLSSTVDAYSDNPLKQFIPPRSISLVFVCVFCVLKRDFYF
ncbi:Hypothetical predicted protein [Podarcis lilfordi]|uniref:Uncharacterized protein n=1 Tax=Podarcis lilfordi TaxID=74358 RepID=A0AA35PKU0_9SAUR|nr:Hypothetical predicted protein [Podarcis lilfordi]